MSQYSRSTNGLESSSALFDQGLSLQAIGIYEVDISEDRQADFGLSANLED